MRLLIRASGIIELSQQLGFQELCQIRSKVSQNHVGAGSSKGVGGFKNGPFFVKGAYSGCGLDHGVLATDVIGSNRHSRNILILAMISRYARPGFTMTMSAPSAISSFTS